MIYNPLAELETWSARQMLKFRRDEEWNISKKPSGYASSMCNLQIGAIIRNLAIGGDIFGAWGWFCGP
jgi:hypothetical protein